ncbi:MAG: Gfo/Idh/MocA family oxidoreductase [Elusimicrobiales bacterium]|nr:Gfo/Idh/MocA family oxidoreductase [Elusimicrobiales bacterium]
MTEKKKIRFGVVGAGKIGNFHSRTLASMPEIKLVGISDINILRAQELAWRYDSMAYKNYADILPQVDAIVIAAPTQFHTEIALAAMEKGIHCLVEKPITDSVENAKKLLKMAEEKKVVLQVGHVERFNPAVVEALKHVKNPKFVTIERLGPYDPRVSSIGVTLDLMIHDLDIVLTMMDSPLESFEAVGASLLSDHDDISNVRLKFKSGCIVDVTASRATMEIARRMRVYQEENYISVDYASSRIKIYEKKNSPVQSLKDISVSFPKITPKQPIREELYHLIDCIENSKNPVPSGEKGLMALKLALDITDNLKKYELKEPKNALGKNSILQSIADAGKATKVMVEEGLKNSGIDKS